MSTMIEAVLAGRIAVITGGARGLGYAMARALAESGASVALLDRLDTVGAAADRLTAETGAEAIGVHVDVTDEASVSAAFDAVSARFGAADILVNSAGMTLGAPAIDTEVADWNRLFEVNVTGTFLASRTFARAFVAANAGRPGEDRGVASIVNVSSMSAFAVNIPQTQAAYNTSKAAVSMLTSSLAIEWLPLGIRVNAIAPGYFASDMTRDFVAENPEMAETWVSKIPSGRMGQPEELGDLVVYLASERSAYVVGQSFRIDGGYTVV
ncbi:SDR family NAD(P)-dependent oxidoreductase [Plantibacter sp. YIM 135347]|uniref:SDR family NAD(P)-dependent oxidoreductase n=1 Tax=Plantibacter sp. YIM 135347 TaxID=3423919 RepID=UPI003D350037